jgi:phenylpropionate dioxygenase-like ring-hydroxylating dioxygenase large terminal subunit
MRNVCLHRGRKLATHSGCKEQFRCPYHGLTWNTDGSFKHNPFAWDFPQIDEKAFNLPDVRVETWAGFVFVNFDRGAAPLLDLLGDMPAHFEHWRMQDCYKAAHIAKVMPANWKACAEAFLEASHVSATHPQMGPYGGTDSTQYDLISDHVTRFLFPTGVTSEALWDGPELTEVRKIEAMLAVGSRAGLPGQKAESIDLGPGENTRTYMGEIARQALSKETGYDFSSACDGDLIDGHSYDIFPNFHIWGGFPQRICYRFRPLGMNHEQTYQEVMLFKIKPKGATPPPAAMRLLAADEPWASATELSYLAGIFDQDESNLGPQQQGLRAMGADGVVQFSRYSDMRCRNLHRMVDDYMSR